MGQNDSFGFGFTTLTFYQICSEDMNFQTTDKCLFVCFVDCYGTLETIIHFLKWMQRAMCLSIQLGGFLSTPKSELTQSTHCQHNLPSFDFPITRLVWNFSETFYFTNYTKYLKPGNSRHFFFTFDRAERDMALFLI